MIIVEICYSAFLFTQLQTLKALSINCTASPDFSVKCNFDLLLAHKALYGMQAANEFKYDQFGLFLCLLHPFKATVRKFLNDAR